MPKALNVYADDNHKIQVPGRHHLDRRADQLAADGSSDDDAALSTKELAKKLGVSEQWLAIARCRGFGPPWRRYSPRMIRYCWGDVKEWLRHRAHQRTAEYQTGPRLGRQPGSRVVNGKVVLPDADHDK